MKFLEKNISKITILCIFLVLLNFLTSFPVYAESSDDGVGGKLLQPVMDLVISIGDGIVNIIHDFCIGQEESLVRIDTSDTVLGKVLKVIAFVRCNCIRGVRYSSDLSDF